MSNHKSALVTGATKGIGREIARQLGDLGYTVIVGARDQARGEATDTPIGVQLVPLVWRKFGHDIGCPCASVAD